jgi:hypothetical protein
MNCLIQIGDQILFILDSNRDAHKIRRQTAFYL